MKRMIAAALAVLLCLPLLACGACREEPSETVRRLEFVDSATYRLLDDAGNAVRTYRRAEYAYLPNHMLRNVWAECHYTAANGQKNSFYFYATEEASAENFLVMADPDDYYPYFFIVADGYKLPTLAELAPTQVSVCGTEEDLFWMASNVLDKIYLQERVDALVSAFTLGAAVALPTDTPQASAEMIFSAPESNTEISFYCTAYLFPDGSAYLHEGSSGHTVAVDAALLCEYYPFKTDAG